MILPAIAYAIRMNDSEWQAGLDRLTQGDKREARRIFRSIVRKYPDNPEAWWMLASATDEVEQKVHCLLQVLRLRPDHAQARDMLGRAQRQVTKTTPVDGVKRPVLDTVDDGNGLRIAPDSVSATAPERGSARQIEAPMWRLNLLVVLILALTAIIGGGIAVWRIVSAPATTPAATRSLHISVEGCITLVGTAAKLNFVNSTDFTVGVARGSAGAEEFLFQLAPGAQHSVDVTDSSPTRYTATAAANGATSSGAVIEVPAGSVCNVPIR